MYGATRITKDFDCLIRQAEDNLSKLAAAMRELNARLHFEGLTDAEAALLPVRIDATSLKQMEISTWRKDAGDFDVLVDIPDRNGRHREARAGGRLRVDRDRGLMRSFSDWVPPSLFADTVRPARSA